MIEPDDTVARSAMDCAILEAVDAYGAAGELHQTTRNQAVKESAWRILETLGSSLSVLAQEALHQRTRFEELRARYANSHSEPG